MHACLLSAQPTCVQEITGQATGAEPGRSPSALPGCVPMLSVVAVSEPSLSHLLSEGNAQPWRDAEEEQGF